MDGSMCDFSKRGRTSSVFFGQFDTYRLLGDLSESTRSDGSKPLICEVAYTPEVGQWSYFHLRADKDKPNLYTVVVSVLLDQAENLSAEDP